MTSQHVSVVTSPPFYVYWIIAYVTQILLPSNQSRAGAHPFNKLKMICNKCQRYHEDHAKVSNNIRQVNYLLESTKQMEEFLEKVERLAMLHKHARSNYI